VAIDTLGILLWTGSVLGAGTLAGPLVKDVVEALQAFGKRGVAMLACVLLAYLALKWRQRRRAAADLAITRVSIDDLRRMLAALQPVQIVDVRAAEIQELEGRIPGAIALAVDAHDSQLAGLAPGHPVVVYCGCPNEVSAVHLVKRLRAQGYAEAHPLAGGVEAWREAGMPMQTALASP
jgi:rhodanese-related sulfurtransferase